MEHLVVIGGNAAGMSAASAARRENSGMDITVFEKGPHISYSTCGIPYYIGGIVPEVEALQVYSPDFFRRERRIDVRVHHEVSAIYPARRVVRVTYAKTGITTDVPYSKLVIATGAYPVVPEVSGVTLPGIFTLRNLQDSLNIRQHMTRLGQGCALIAGGGYVGLEMAEALCSAGWTVRLIDTAPRLLNRFDPEIDRLVRSELSRHQVTLLTGVGIRAFSGDVSGVRSVSLSNGEIVPAGMVILAAGIRPSVQLATEAGIQLGNSGAIAVNKEGETSRTGIFAAGDCAEVRHVVTGQPVYMPLGTTANKQGRIAGINAAGGRAVFDGVCGTSVFKLFDLTVAATGLTFNDALTAGYEPVSAAITHSSRAKYYPGAKPLWINLTADKRTGRLLGGEIAGEDVGKRIDTIAVALTNRMAVQDMAFLDLSYSPPFAPAWEPLLIAAHKLKQKLTAGYRLNDFV